MLFVIDKPQLQRLIAIARDDRTRESQSRGGPFFRIEASETKLRLSGHKIEVEWPATVYEPGVLFLRITMFRQILGFIRGQKFIAIQVSDAGLFLDDARMPLEANDMLLYPDPQRAPARHPDDTYVEPPVVKPAAPPKQARKVWHGPMLFDVDDRTSR